MADPGFPRLGRRPPTPDLEGKQKSVIWSRFLSKSAMKMKEIGPRGVLAPPLNPQMGEKELSGALSLDPPMHFDMNLS